MIPVALQQSSFLTPASGTNLPIDHACAVRYTDPHPTHLRLASPAKVLRYAIEEAAQYLRQRHILSFLSNDFEKQEQVRAFWIWICTSQGPFLAIFATELGERNANINFLLKKNSLCGFTVLISSI